MADDDFIVPPAWLNAPAAPAPASPPADEPAPDEITLPPGLADSVTNRLPQERQRTPPPKPEVTFFPGAIGAPVLPAPPTAPPAPPAAPKQLRWSITLENGLSVPVTGAVYLGRNPSAAAEHPTAATLTIDDPRKSISKTHALLVVDGATAWLTDLHSTNGCAVLFSDGSETVLTPGEAVAVPSGASIELGEYAIRLTHG